jgi:hypothetical protein
MTKKIGDKKLTGVKSTTQASEVAGAEAIGGIGSIKPTSGVGGIKGPGAIGKRRPTRVMTVEERQQLLNMISEETEKMFSSGVLPPRKKEVVAKAVKLAVDASLISKEEAEDHEKPRK